VLTAPPDFAIRAAVNIGACSECDKSQRGVSIFIGDRIIGLGFNDQPPPLRCTADARCHATCGKLCEHAEQLAIRAALCELSARAGRAVATLEGAQLVHAKVVGGALVAGGGPSCWQCSRLVLAVGLDGVWLYEARPPEGQQEDWCTQTDQHCHDCPLCQGEDCERCLPGPGRPQCDHDVLDRHGDLPTVLARWRYYTALEFHRATLAECERKGWR
jgi:deoxycytidylate deaminase